MVSWGQSSRSSCLEWELHSLTGPQAHSPFAPGARVPEGLGGGAGASPRDGVPGPRGRLRGALARTALCLPATPTWWPWERQGPGAGPGAARLRSGLTGPLPPPAPGPRAVPLVCTRAFTRRAFQSWRAAR